MEINVIILAIAAGLIASKILMGTVGPEEEQIRELRLEKFRELSKNLSSVSAEIDELLRGLADAIDKKTEELTDIESELVKAKSDFKEIQVKIAVLEKTPLPVAEYFADLQKAAEKKNALLAWFLFLLGIILTTILNIVLKKVGMA
jgi:septal ring factor EnvC (AmiA/AmiB activator)